MKKLCRLIFLFISISVIWVLNDSFKNTSVTNINDKLKPASLKDTLVKQKLPLYTDSASYYSGYLGNLEPIRNQILNGKHIDSLLKRPLPIYYALTDKDKKKYVLNIDQNTIKKPGDTLIFGKKYLVTSLTVRFTNYSKDTLKYLSMDCSWLDSYFTDNKTIQFAKQLCFKNEPCVKTIPPHHTVNIYIPIVLKTNASHLSLKFRIGMSLEKFVNYKQFWDFDAFIYMLRPETTNIIWSNEVSIP
jgi:hypothetical protein